MRRSLLWLSAFPLLVSGFFLINVDTLFAQVDRGSIIGLVTDPAGARVSGARGTLGKE